MDAVVAQDLSALSVGQLQAAVALASPQAQRLSGFAWITDPLTHPPPLPPRQRTPAEEAVALFG